MDEQRHVALPKLYGAPAYARPPVVPANPVPRSVNPDDLPLLADLDAEDHDGLDDGGEAIESPDNVDEAGALDLPSEEAIGAVPRAAEILPRPFSIRHLAERIRGSRR